MLATSPFEANGEFIGAFDFAGELFFTGELSNGAAYMAQSFVLPKIDDEGELIAESISFTILNNYLAPSPFRLLVTELDGMNEPPPGSSAGVASVNPGEILFESSDLLVSDVDLNFLPFLSSAPNNPRDFTVSLNSLSLEADTPYAFILDFAVLFDGVQNAVSWETSTGYSDGFAFFLSNPVSGSRLTDFGNNWTAFGAVDDVDLRFSVEYFASDDDDDSDMEVSEPGTLALLGLGLAGMGLARRGREKSL